MAPIRARNAATGSCWCARRPVAARASPRGKSPSTSAGVRIMTTGARLSKSRFTSGLQCHKKLWWEVHEPNAVELQPDKVLQDLFDQGRQVGEAARGRYPGGVLIDLPHHAGAARVAATQKALGSGAPAVFEATFIADATFVAIDV